MHGNLTECGSGACCTVTAGDDGKDWFTVKADLAGRKQWFVSSTRGADIILARDIRGAEHIDDAGCGADRVKREKEQAKRSGKKVSDVISSVRRELCCVMTAGTRTNQIIDDVGEAELRVASPPTAQAPSSSCAATGSEWARQCGSLRNTAGWTGNWVRCAAVCRLGILAGGCFLHLHEQRLLHRRRAAPSLRHFRRRRR